MAQLDHGACRNTEHRECPGQELARRISGVKASSNGERVHHREHSKPSPVRSRAVSASDSTGCTTVACVSGRSPALQSTPALTSLWAQAPEQTFLSRLSAPGPESASQGQAQQECAAFEVIVLAASKPILQAVECAMYAALRWRDWGRTVIRNAERDQVKARLSQNAHLLRVIFLPITWVSLRHLHDITSGAS